MWNCDYCARSFFFFLSFFSKSLFTWFVFFFFLLICLPRFHVYPSSHNQIYYHLVMPQTDFRFRLNSTLRQKKKKTKQKLTVSHVRGRITFAIHPVSSTAKWIDTVLIVALMFFCAVLFILNFNGHIDEQTVRFMMCFL